MVHRKRVSVVSWTHDWGESIDQYDIVSEGPRICFTLAKNCWDAILKLRPKQEHWKEIAIDH